MELGGLVQKHKVAGLGDYLWRRRKDRDGARVRVGRNDALFRTEDPCPLAWTVRSVGERGLRTALAASTACVPHSGLIQSESP